MTEMGPEWMRLKQRIGDELALLNPAAKRRVMLDLLAEAEEAMTMRRHYSWGLGDGITCTVEIAGPEKTELTERNVRLMAKHVELLREAVQLDEIGVVLDDNNRARKQSF